MLAGGLGVGVPADLTYEPADPGPGLVFDIESRVTDSAEILDLLRDSMDHVRRALATTDGASLDAEVELLSGVSLPRRDLCMIVMTHQNQHLGQAIAYARSMGVVPPWSVPGS